MSKVKYFSQYKSPNIVITPNTVLCYPPSPKRQKVEVPKKKQSPQHVDISFLDDFNIDEIVEWLNNCDRNDKIKELDDKLETKVDTTSSIYNKKEVIFLSKENLTDKAKNNDNRDDINNEHLQNIMLDSADEKNNLLTKDEVGSNVDTDIKTDVKAINSPIDSKDIEAEYVTGDMNLEDSNCKSTLEENNIKDSDNISNNNTKEFNSNENKISIINNTESANNLNASVKTQNIKNLSKEKVNSNIIEKKKLNNQTKRKSSPFKMHCKYDIISPKLLEKRIYNYLHKKYSVERVVHYGEFSKIFKCKDDNGNQYAIKLLKKRSHGYVEDIKKKEEMLLAIQADVPKENLYCVNFIDSFSLNGFWCYLTDFYPKNLKQALEESGRPFHINLVKYLARQLVTAVILLKNLTIVHSDINPNHILLNSSYTTLKLCGFDTSYYMSSAKITPYTGIVNYRPPEVILGYSAGYSIDVWTTALVLYEMATGYKLFPGFNNWHVLYSQMTTLGGIPPKMIYKSKYQYKYFNGVTFKNKYGIKGQTFSNNNLFSIQSDGLSNTVYGSYHSHWNNIRTESEKNRDLQEIKSFICLLNKMLVIWPNYRITIEFVYANPFVYEMFTH